MVERPVFLKGLLLRLLAAGAVVAVGFPLRAEPEWQETVAGQVAASTVTVRMWPGLSPEQQATAGAEQNAPSNIANQAPTAGEQVIVSSGVCVGPGLIITAGHSLVRRSPAAARFRITHADGQQSKAALAVLDHYSNLCLLVSPDEKLPALPLGETEPNVGAPVLTAAAAGIEAPVVSVGIVGGVERSPETSGLPPLLQCDVRTTASSGGAAIVDREGKLLGVVMAAELQGQRAGWTFAVPVRHVRRLLDARRPEELVVLERRRPTVGLTMGQGPQEGSVVVERVTSGGPAAAAGIRPGDVIVEAAGRKIRSAYQAVDLILARQPGESIAFLVQREGERIPVRVVLGGDAGGLAQQAPSAVNAPQVNVRVVGRNQIEVRNNDARVANVAELAAGNQQQAPRAPRDEIGMLQEQLTAFEKVIAKLQAEVRRRDQLLEETNELVKSLTAEVEALRKQQGK